MCVGRIALRQNFASHYARQLGTLAGLLVMIAVLWVLTPHFLTISNLLNIAEQATIIAIIAVGMTFVIITGGIDLSVGSVLAFSGVVMASALQHEFPLPIALLVGLGVGLLSGLVNGILITVGRLILSELVPVVSAQQALFYVLDANQESQQLTLLASYADRGQKKVGRQLALGEGLRSHAREQPKRALSLGPGAAVPIDQLVVRPGERLVSVDQHGRTIKAETVGMFTSPTE